MQIHRCIYEICTYNTSYTYISIHVHNTSIHVYNSTSIESFIDMNLHISYHDVHVHSTVGVSQSLGKVVPNILIVVVVGCM